MNRNRHLSTKKGQKRVRSGANVSPEFKVVLYPDHVKHTQPHNLPQFATKTRAQQMRFTHSKKKMA